MLNIRSAAAGPTKTLLIVRHGATKLNNQTDMSEDRIRGWSNVPLSSEGIAEAHQAAADLAQYEPEIIFSSDLERALMTAQIIANSCHCPLQSTPILRPWNLGKMQGQVTKTALPIIQRFVCDAPDQPVPEGESFSQFKDRALVRGLPYLVQAIGEKTALLVTHHRDERLYFAWRDAGFPPDFKIHLPTFLQKGESPGAVLPFEVPIAALFARQEYAP